MRLSVAYHDGRLEFEGADDRLVAGFDPPARPGDDLDGRIGAALETPVGYPPLRRVVVPGDRVVVPIDRTTPEASALLRAVHAVLVEAGVESVTALVDGRVADRAPLGLPPGVELIGHDPADRDSLAYLASTVDGRRVYLHRLLADADAVVPIGRLGRDARGPIGPWTVIDPGLSDRDVPPTSLWNPPGGPASGDGALEVCWLLGCQFVVGVVPAESGVLDVIAGQTTAVRDRAAAVLEARWTVRAPDRADLVVAGVGGPGRPASPADLAEGLRVGLAAVRRGGKLALITRASIADLREAFRGPAVPKGDLDRALAWADVYLAGAADADEVEDLGLVPLDRPDRAVKLVGLAPSFLTIGQADRASVAIRPES